MKNFTQIFKVFVVEFYVIIEIDEIVIGRREIIRNSTLFDEARCEKFLILECTDRICKIQLWIKILK